MLMTLSKGADFYFKALGKFPDKNFIIFGKSRDALSIFNFEAHQLSSLESEKFSFNGRNF